MSSVASIAVHQYKKLDIDIVETVIQKNLDDLLAFAEAVRSHLA